MKTVVNTQTGEVSEVELTEKEIKDREKEAEKWLADKPKRDKKAALPIAREEAIEELIEASSGPKAQTYLTLRGQ